MKLDPRIKSLSDILTIFDIDRAKDFIGQKGYFADSLYCFDDLGSCYRDILTDACDGQAGPFHRMESYNCQQFFIPESSLRPAETPAEKKKWRPFTLDEFLAKFPLLSPVTYRGKENSNCYTVLVIGHGCSRNETMRVNLGGYFYELNNLFNCYDLQDKDGNWLPFGVEE